MSGSRGIRSYVLRSGRITPAQQRALDQHLPNYAISACTAPLNLSQAFNRDAPVVLDIGTGNGESTLTMATARPDCNLLAVEVYPCGIGSLLQGIVAGRIENIRILRQDVNTVLRALPAESIDLALLWFPDPWPKKRHHKRRLVNLRLLRLLGLRLRQGARVWIATDCESYAQAILDCLEQQSLLVNLCAPGAYAPRPLWRHPTRFERRALQAGHVIRELALARAL